MSNNLDIRMVLATLSVALITAGCSSDRTAEVDVVQSVPSFGGREFNTTTSQRSHTGAKIKPPVGFGNAQGRVIWGGKPLAGIAVQLCESALPDNACGGKNYKALTDKNGNYTINKVPPGSYKRLIQISKSSPFFQNSRPRSGTTKMYLPDFKIVAGQTLDMNAIMLLKDDLQIISPQAGEVIKGSMPQLKWKPYPGAARYFVGLGVPLGVRGFEALKTEQTHFDIDRPLLNGEYGFSITAYNAKGDEIAQTFLKKTFKVVDGTSDTKVQLEYPVRDAVMSGKGIVFKWKKYPIASGYEIYLRQKDERGSRTVLSNERVKGNSYSLNLTLMPGVYEWNLSATYKGAIIAGSISQTFRVM